MSKWTLELLIVLLPLIALAAVLAVALLYVIGGEVRRRYRPPHRIRVMTEAEIALRQHPDGGVVVDRRRDPVVIFTTYRADAHGEASWDR